LEGAQLFPSWYDRNRFSAFSLQRRLGQAPVVRLWVHRAAWRIGINGTME
jgi:hypothetical protein